MDKIQFIEEAMKQIGLSQAELLAHWKQKSKKQAAKEDSPAMFYPYEVLFTDGSRSWEPQEYKVPWGIIVGNSAFILYGTDQALPFAEAERYCKNLFADSTKCQCANQELWQRLASCSDEELANLNEFLVSLGGRPLNQAIWADDGIYVDFSEVRQRGLYKTVNTKPRQFRASIKL